MKARKAQYTADLREDLLDSRLSRNGVVRVKSVGSWFSHDSHC